MFDKLKGLISCSLSKRLIGKVASREVSMAGSGRNLQDVIDFPFIIYTLQGFQQLKGWSGKANL